MKIFLILGDPECDHVIEIQKLAASKGFQSVIFNSSDYPQYASIDFDPNGEIILTLEKTSIKTSNIKCAYWRSYAGASPRRIGKDYVDLLSERDSTSILESLLQLPHIEWFNGYDAWSMHKCKPLQLYYVNQLGVKIPQTRITNDPQQAQEFYKQGFELIFKPVYGGAETEIVQKTFMTNEHLDRVFTASPVTLQEYIKGTNVRSYVIGEKVISSEIISDAVDFRTDLEHEVKPVDTPRFIEDQAKNICKALRLKWTAIDWRLDQNGNYYFLEANPSPMFIGFSTKYCINIGEILVTEMLNL